MLDLHSGAAPEITLDASDPGFYSELNRPTYLRILADDPVYWVEAQYTQPFWNVCSHDLIREVGQAGELFTTEFGVHLNAAAFDVKHAGGPTDGDDQPSIGLGAELPVALRPANVMDAYGHRRLRAPINQYFRPGMAARLEPAIRAEIRAVLEGIDPGKELEFMQVFATRVPLLATTRLLGVGIEREADFELWANTILESFEPGATPDFGALGEMVGFFASEVAARRASPRDDLMTELTRTELTDDEVVMWCWLLLVAGLETTGNLIGAGFNLLMLHPETKDRLIAEPALIHDAVSEMLRVITPGRYIRRTATRDTELGGHRIAKGDAVVMNFTVANHDPEMFPDPLRFDIDRRPSDTLAFSWGPHRCIGAPVALVEAKVAFEELLARFPNIEARGPAVFHPSLATVVVKSIPVAFQP